jgi:hypothetical protein
MGVVTPKVVDLKMTDKGARAMLVGFGSDRAVEYSFDRSWKIDGAASHTVPPGTAAFVPSNDGWLFANSLLDAWVWVDADWRYYASPLPYDLPEHAATTNERLGEALLFTTLMAPDNSTAGPLSRFTCETCHFEGAVDGRTHHTGRGQVRATTKPLFGLFNNRPHFSRALDKDLTKVSHSEFRVAGAGSDRDPWSDLRVLDHPWLQHLGISETRVSPLGQRRAVMEFLMRFSHRPNPHALERSGFSRQEKLGAELFQERCERCHQARLSSDVEESRQPAARWEEFIFSEAGPIVWASDTYQATGVLPYVHELGARVPSLRRLERKWPFFTNGSARSLQQVLAAVRYDDQGFSHAAEQSAPAHRLDEQQREALLQFLRLL